MEEGHDSWYAAVLANLKKGGPVCQGAAAYIEQHGTPIGFARQSTGARWTVRGAIELNPVYYPPGMDPSSPRLLGAVVHEATHLEQGLAHALTVEGEVAGWRAEFDARAELGAAIPSPHWRTVAQTPTPPTRANLRIARAAIRQMTSYRYLIWLLPLKTNILTRLIGRMAERIWTRAQQHFS
ncbi:MAG: hypothetical protein JW900_10355 [Anaerolineae bacterium]|nr:hypothetical protein [Anaerolineae bacterium]